MSVALLDLKADGQTPFNQSMAVLEQACDPSVGGADIAVLPEQFRGAPNRTRDYPAESVAGPTIQAVGAVARRYGCYVVAPIRELDPATGRQFNTAVLVGRDGSVVASYRKAFPVYGSPDGSIEGETNVHPGPSGVSVVELPGIGRVAMLICFDINFTELWQEAWWDACVAIDHFLVAASA